MAGGTSAQYCSTKCPETFGPENDRQPGSIDPGLGEGDDRGAEQTVKDSSRCLTASSSRVTKSQGEYNFYNFFTRLWLTVTLFL